MYVVVTKYWTRCRCYNITSLSLKVLPHLGNWTEYILIGFLLKNFPVNIKFLTENTLRKTIDTTVHRQNYTLNTTNYTLNTTNYTLNTTNYTLEIQ